MATIKAIEARSIHQIQSGQVIVDLCSVVKELVENSLDAGATSLEVRFKNNGLDSIEVQDNGSGISPENYESIALKHYTSKLASYEDLTSLQTFGFRGEALSSLCALSNFHILTARAEDVPKAKRLEFEISGRLKSTTVVAGQKGTTAVVEDLFQNLPVRRRELEKNIKREYQKVLGLLHAYACISVNVKFTVKNSMPKGKNVAVFATNSNPTTKENIANVYGAKTLSALIPLDLSLEFESTLASQRLTGDNGIGQNKIFVHGHISRPVFGEGRQTPDRQMFFVNSRPCGLPQIAKAFNEVYRSFNVSQSPFIFADFRMDTNAYDVNVSPDKRTIMLHDAAALIESLKSCLIEMFEKQDQTVPQSQLYTPKLPAFKQLTIPRDPSADSATTAASIPTSQDSDGEAENDDISNAEDVEAGEESAPPKNLLHDFFRNQASTREEPKAQRSKSPGPSTGKRKFAKAMGESNRTTDLVDDYEDARDIQEADAIGRGEKSSDIAVRDFNARMAEQQRKHVSEKEVSPDPSPEREESIPRMQVEKVPEQPNILQNAFDRLRPKRVAEEVATITIGDKTVTTVIGSQPLKKPKIGIDESPKYTRKKSIKTSFGQSLRDFAAPGTQVDVTSSKEEDEAEESAPEDSEPDNEVPPSEVDIDGSQSVEQSPALDAEDIALNAVDDETEVERDGESEEDEEEDNDERAEVRYSSDDAEADGDYMDDVQKKAREEAKVAELIRVAEEQAAMPTEDNLKRAAKALKGGNHKDSTASLQLSANGSLARIEEQLILLQKNLQDHAGDHIKQGKGETSIEPESEEERLSLTVSKEDFAQMSIAGQFNLGFILATRTSPMTHDTQSATTRSDELFIIDQHASDEKYNFERLQNETTVGNQRLVQPRSLDLTALEEEIIIENLPALEKNGFLVAVDDSGDEPIGRRCKLISLPLSKEVVFDTRDLEELIHLLAESPTLGPDSAVPRPSKVRKMFAMRACRSSVMVGKTLSAKQMGRIVGHMGEIDKPWNCPHGRPTMRHLMTLNAFESWNEGEGLAGLGEDDEADVSTWEQYINNT